MTLRVVGVVDHRELGLSQPLDLVAQARGFLEVEVGGGLAHPRLQAGQHGLEIVPDGGGVGELAFAAAGRDQHVVALIDRVMMSWIERLMLSGVMLFAVVVLDLLLAPPVGFLDGALHRAGDAVA